MQRVVFLLIAMCYVTSVAQQYHVAKTGSDSNIGSISHPFRTISQAAKIAVTGDTIIVHEGTYREWVQPQNSGSNPLLPIVYRAAKGEDVWIKGSERIQTWKRHKGSVWKVVLKNSFFKGFNPYKEVVKGDWLIDTFGRDHHLGEVYLNGKALYETTEKEQVFDLSPMQRTLDPEGSKFKWFCESNEDVTTIYAHFNGKNPNKELVEINVRPAVFYPKQTGVNYITVSGFKLCHAATQWAPPTANQEGLIGPNWSKGWVIENNVISDSKCSGVSLGKEYGSGQNEWSLLKVKHGTQTQREVTFRAIEKGWSMDNIGSHIVRNNTISNCEQAGICGNLGAVNSRIENNHIYNIHIKKQFFGYEIGGIKLHAAIDVTIDKNLIHNNFRGIWLDWQAQGARVSRNVLFDNFKEDFFNEVNHGPLLVDHNIMLSEVSILNVSQGTAFAHNLFAGTIRMRKAPHRFTPYHFPHSTAVMGLMGILHGDDRFYNNIFMSDQEPKIKTEFNGLDAYDGHPISTGALKDLKSLEDYATVKLPVYAASNFYANKAKPFNKEKDYCMAEHQVKFQIEKNDNGYDLHLTIDEAISSETTVLVDTNFLGTSFQTKSLYELPSQKPVVLNKDFYDLKRNTEHPVFGPFESLKEGEQKFRLFDFNN